MTTGVLRSFLMRLSEIYATLPEQEHTLAHLWYQTGPIIPTITMRYQDL